MDGGMRGSEGGGKESKGKTHRLKLLILCFFSYEPRSSILQELRLQ